jgi:hypothetical protein
MSVFAVLIQMYVHKDCVELHERIDLTQQNKVFDKLANISHPEHTVQPVSWYLTKFIHVKSTYIVRNTDPKLRSRAPARV